MTTPEALRDRQMKILENEERIQSRQKWLGRYILLVGLVLIAVVVYFNVRESNREDDTRACIAENTAAQNDVLRTRGVLAERESRLNQREGRITARWQEATQTLFIVGIALRDAGDLEGVAELVQKTFRIWASVDEDRAKVVEIREQIRQERADNPIPDFPEGTCE